MYRHFARLLCIAVCLSTLTAFAQDEFSGDVFNAQPGKDAVLQAKIYMAKDKMRIESQQQRAGAGGVMILNFATQTNTVVMPERKMYMEFPQGQGPQQRAFQYFRVGDVQNACGEWQKLATNHGATCRKVGTETVNGRSTVKYEGTNANGETGDFWLDSDLRFPVKWSGKNGSGELRNINVGSQPASLFEVPAGFQKMQMPMGLPPNLQHP